MRWRGGVQSLSGVYYTTCPLFLFSLDEYLSGSWGGAAWAASVHSVCNWCFDSRVPA